MLRFVCSVAMRRVRRALCVPHPQSWSVFGGVWLSIAAIMLMLPLPLCGVSLPLLTHPVVANSPKFNSLCLTAPFKLVVPASSPGRSLAGIGAARDNSFFVDSVPLLGGLSSAFVTGAFSGCIASDSGTDYKTRCNIVWASMYLSVLCISLMFFSSCRRGNSDVACTRKSCASSPQNYRR
eukprot:GHVT01102410.1.p1 GENE.GHVT01102410.1~~GHVT01102410.1.p1  ORF type:complete len:180 (+),score=7.16 GHVT01102410.1:489-1028(+)